jgi:ABC transporter DrrB family efflux protein
MRRRLDLASSLIGSPRMVFLDEPTTGLDPRSRNEVWTAVRQLVRDGTTVLLTTQYLEEADQLADRIAVIDHGRLIAEGTSDQLKDRLGGQVLEVRLAQPGEREQARAALAGVGCGNPQPSERQDELTMAASRGGVELVTDAAAALRERGIAVNDLALRRPTLDDVFLELTGNPPSEDGAGSDDADGRALADRAGPERLDGAAGPDGAARPDGAGAAVAARGGPAVAARASSAVAARASSAVAADTAHPRARPGRWRQAVQHDRLALRRTVADTWIVTRRNLLHFVRQPQLLIFSTVQPIMFVLLFVYVFGGAIKGSLPHGVPYVDFLLPGIFVQSVAFRATQTAVGLSEDLERGVVDRFRSMPMARSAVLAGRTVADLVRNVLIIGLMVLVGYVIGFRFRGTVPDVIGCVLVVSAFGLALSWIFAFVALTVRGAEAAQSAGFVAIFPLVFASSVFVPVSSMPAWLAAFAKVSPVTLTADAARAFALGGSTSGSLPGALAWAGGLLAVFIPLCVWRYRRIS